MKCNIYCIRDLKVGFGSPMVDMSDESAIRGFSYAMSNKDSIMNFNPKDFDLYKIGTYDTEKGLIVSEYVPVLICSGTSVIGV